ncbi:glycoside hydrolase family 79 protein [Purpureocillium lilacinum]|uniref:Glycoside hydrolase family 79 protein n=1 Tax=Purpureocillium lilacinum TaxID=33203 RepID=A0A179H5F7_PURLI|nr:glycoside hydrolase family 79 protein [Purpureocillium lilacinum]OAQ85232.1 glycoside hydrolase family 79 protein [Purpureocillium lilacinum]
MTALLVLSLAALAVSQTTCQSVTLNLQQKVPAGASKLIDSSFPSFAIQGSSFASYTGNASHPNTFSRNLIRSVEERTGGPLVVRVGGTNTDYSNFNPDQALPVTPPQQGAGIGQKFVFGPVFYEGFRNWPGTRWVYDVPFAKSNKTNSQYEARAAVDNIGLENLEALEIGNEVDLYVKQGSRPGGYGPAEFSADWRAYADWLVGALGLPAGPLFQTLTLSSAHAAPFSAQSVFDAGITDGNLVKSVSLHHYEYTNTTTGLQSTLMNHTFVKDGLNAYLPDFEYMQAHYSNVQVVLGESGRYTDKQSSIDQSEGIFGSALWTADYLLYAASLNVTRVNMQLGQVFGYVAWHPIAFDGLQPEVRSPYYGHLLVADFIGKSKAFRVSEVQTNDDLVAAYAGYEQDQLRRVAIINYKVWQKGSGARPARTFTLPVPRGVRSVKVQTLTSSGGASVNGTASWAGRTWTYENNGVGEKVPGLDEFTTVPVSGGRANVKIGASEAVIVHI